MRCWLALVPLVGVFVISSASGAQAQTATQDYARGNVSYASSHAVASFDARSGPNGEHPTGFAFWFELLGANEGGFVTCLNVTGNRATIGVSSGALLFVEDNSASGMQDNFVGQTVASSPSVCPANTVVYPPPNDFPISGEIVVRNNGPADPAKRMVGKGSLTGANGGTASYAYIVNCEPPTNTGAPFEVRFGTQRFRLTSTNTVGCASSGFPFCDGHLQSGSGSGTLTSGGPATIGWSFCDGGPGGAGDGVGLQIRNAAGAIIFNSDPLGSPPGPFPGSTQATGNNTFQNVP
jgi:hypothetical protein